MVTHLTVTRLWALKGRPECDTVVLDLVRWDPSLEVVQWEATFHEVLILVWCLLEAWDLEGPFHRATWAHREDPWVQFLSGHHLRCFLSILDEGAAATGTNDDLITIANSTLKVEMLLDVRHLRHHLASLKRTLLLSTQNHADQRITKNLSKSREQKVK